MQALIPGAGARPPSLGLGTLALAGAYGPVGDADALAVVSRAIELGVSLIDTADVYGDGDGESIVGRAIAGRDHEVTVATKVGLVDGGRGGVRNDRSYLRAAVGASLLRLGVERIDLLFLHRVDPVVPIEETMEVLAELVREGMVASLGLSEVTATELERASTVHPIAAVQSEWSVWSRDVERWVVPACARAGVTFIASAPLGRGFLAGRTTAPQGGDGRGRVPRLSDDHRTSNLAVALELSKLAHREGLTPAQLALVWLHHAGDEFGVRVLPIPGARSIAQLEENLISIERRASAETLIVLDGLAGRVSGARGNARWLSFGRE
ncbi:aldo/keto reductase [Agrococcus sp. UYP33]